VRGGLGFLARLLAAKTRIGKGGQLGKGAAKLPQSVFGY
jgi:hypothetical protein